MAHEEDIWQVVRGIETDIHELQIWRAESSEREKSHVKEMEHMMKEFRSFSGQQEISLSNIQKSVDEIKNDIARKDGARDTKTYLIMYVLPLLVMTAALMVTIYQVANGS